MSNDYSDDEFLLDGYDLSKLDLKRRLQKMDYQLDNRDFGQEYYADIYNKLVKQYERRMKIRSLLDADRIAFDGTTLNRKRKRNEEGGDFTNKNVVQNNGKVSGVRNVSLENSLKGNETAYESMQERNIPDLNQFVGKMQNDLTSYREKMQNLAAENRSRGQNDQIMVDEYQGGYNNNNKIMNRVNISAGKEFQEDAVRPSAKENVIYNQGYNQAYNQAPQSKPYGGVKGQMQAPEPKRQSQTSRMAQVPMNYDENTHQQNAPCSNPPIQRDQHSMRTFNSSDDSEDGRFHHPTQVKKSTKNFLLLKGDVNAYKRAGSIAGSTKNVKEVLKTIDVVSNPPMASPRYSTMDAPQSIPKRQQSIMNVSRDRPILSNRDLPNTGRTAALSTKNVTVSVRTMQPFEFQSQNDKIMKNFHIYKAYAKTAGIVFVLIAGALLVLYVKEHSTRLIKSISSENSSIIVVAIVVISVLYLIARKVQQLRKNSQIAFEDFQMIKNVLVKNYETEESPLGLFQSNFIKDAAERRKMKESSYIKKIVPEIMKLVLKDRIIEEGEVIIQNMGQKVWRLKPDKNDDIIFG
jgi:hypothetical protein